jgi:hypothetical protein
MNYVKHLLFCTFAISLSGCGCGCYESHQEAWSACNDKYNGKCRYLGDDFKVCEASARDVAPCSTDSDCASKNPHIEPY